MYDGAFLSALFEVTFSQILQIRYRVFLQSFKDLDMGVKVLEALLFDK